MSELRVYPENDPGCAQIFTDPEAIASELDAVGVMFERWRADRELAADAGQEEVLAAYRGPVERLMKQYDFKSVDVISVHPNHPDREALRAKFLDEHYHTDYEVRFFVDGRGLFCIHKQGKIYSVLCEKGDLISVPAHTTHWFDMGPQPHLKAIRLFTTPEGWAANFTGNDIASRFPRLES